MFICFLNSEYSPQPIRNNKKKSNKNLFLVENNWGQGLFLILHEKFLFSFVEQTRGVVTKTRQTFYVRLQSWVTNHRKKITTPPFGIKIGTRKLFLTFLIIMDLPLPIDPRANKKRITNKKIEAKNIQHNWSRALIEKTKQKNSIEIYQFCDSFNLFLFVSCVCTEMVTENISRKNFFMIKMSMKSFWTPSFVDILLQIRKRNIYDVIKMKIVTNGREFNIFQTYSGQFHL